KALTGSAGHDAQWRIFWNSGGETGYRGFTPGNNTYAFISNSVLAPVAATSASIIFRVAGAAITNQSATIEFDDVALGSGGGAGIPGTTNILPVAGQAVARITWPTTFGAQYQPQSTTNLGSKTWSNFFPMIAGDGGIKSVIL